MSEPREQCPPSDANWYVEVTYGRDVPGGTETDYTYAYFTGDRPSVADRDVLVPDGFKCLESRVTPVTPRRRETP